MGKQKTKGDNYLYDVGDVVNGVLITEQCVKKSKNGITHHKTNTIVMRFLCLYKFRF